MKKKKLIFLTILIILIGGVLYGINKYAVIFNGYAAKEVCSCIYLSGRDQADIEKHDLNNPFVSLPKNVWDSLNRTVTSTFLGMARQTAVYRDGLGCALVADSEIEAIKGQSYKPQYPAYDPDTVYWPAGDKMRDTIPPVINFEKLHKAIQNALDQSHTRAVIVAYDTLFMAEGYNHGFGKDTRILGWSMTKSIMNALAGILVKQGKLHPDEKAPIDEWQHDSRKSITLKNLLQMSSGLAWEEDYGKISDVTKMLFAKSDMAKYAISKPAAFPPDSVWYYSSGTTNIVSEIIKRSLASHEEYLAFPRNALFNKIGMRSIVLETDASGTFVGSSYAFATPRDWARFGLLYLQNGYWGKEQILPDGWVKFSRTPARKSGGRYGAQFWLNRGVEQKALPGAPSDVFYCDGYNGQRIFIIPSHRLVIVRMGVSMKGEFDFDALVASVLNAVEAP